MEMIFCPNCNKLTGYKRAIGFGTFFAVLLTAGLWLLAIPFYPKRCITCGLSKSASVPWYRTWRVVVFPLLLFVVIAVVVETNRDGQTHLAPIVKGPNHNEIPSPTVVSNSLADKGARTEEKKLIPDSITLDETEWHRVKVDAVHPEKEPISVRTIEGGWSKPTLLYSDDFINVYWAFDDQLALENNFPTRDWPYSSFEVLLFVDVRKDSPQRKAMIEAAKNEGDAETVKHLAYEEQRILINTANQTYTFEQGKTVDVVGGATSRTPDGFRGETRDLSRTTPLVQPNETVELAAEKLRLARFITGEIVRRLTGPQHIALDALGAHSLSDLQWDHELEERYITLIHDQVRMLRGIGPDQ